MTCSLETYRQRIGTFQHGLPGKNLCRKRNPKSCNKSNSFRARLIMTLFILNYCCVILTLPILLQTQTQQLEYALALPRPYSCTSTPHQVSSSQSLSLVKLPTIKNVVLLLTWFPDSWDPGPGSNWVSSVYISRIKRNKLAHITFGNRGKRGKGITCIYWNKGPSLLTNKHQDLETIIADHHPHIFGLGEANHRHNQDIEAVQIPEYTLHLDSGIDNSGRGSSLYP